MREFIDKLSDMEVDTIDKVISLADEYGIDRNKAINSFAVGIKILVKIADISEYESKESEE